MDKLTILTYPNAILQRRCNQVRIFDKVLRKLLSDMKKTMIEADGVGLAAPQVGIEQQIAIVEDDEGKIIALINPVILEQTGSQVGPEGCLSFPGLFGEVERPSRIKVRAQDRFGKYFTLQAEDYFARVILHEIDHLEGILFPSKALSLYNEETL
ncbi:peptide deformylase [Bacillus mesophilus]|uniref:Peptide deformylase n=1 Tax=Bacillus mesophilus TaxID=1808955 RepID=A0A6M0Q1Y4_9BACI|nr:peptide deformylase [Bacillus mesophilus]MBM7659414.1 peptide deformylase [Bacillus mesophilus]NEY70287.1 peptide deformylase [Bacillus mesophilus]